MHPSPIISIIQYLYVSPLEHISYLKMQHHPQPAPSSQDLSPDTFVHTRSSPSAFSLTIPLSLLLDGPFLQHFSSAPLSHQQASFTWPHFDLTSVGRRNRALHKKGRDHCILASSPPLTQMPLQHNVCKHLFSR